MSPLSVIDALRPPEASTLDDPLFGKLAFQPVRPPHRAQWVGRVMRSSVSRAPVVVSLDAVGPRPTDAQRQFWLDFEKRSLFFTAAALVHLRPAFSHYVGKQSELRSLLEEFHVVAVRIPAWVDAMDSDLPWTLSFGCITNPQLRFDVTFSGARALRVAVDAG